MRRVTLRTRCATRQNQNSAIVEAAGSAANGFDDFEGRVLIWNTKENSKDCEIGAQ